MFFDGVLVNAEGQVRKRRARAARAVRAGEGTSVARPPETRAAQPVDERHVSVPVPEPGAAELEATLAQLPMDPAVAMTIGRQVRHCVVGGGGGIH